MRKRNLNRPRSQCERSGNHQLNHHRCVPKGVRLANPHKTPTDRLVRHDTSFVPRDSSHRSEPSSPRQLIQSFPVVHMFRSIQFHPHYRLSITKHRCRQDLRFLRQQQSHYLMIAWPDSQCKFQQPRRIPTERPHYLRHPPQSTRLELSLLYPSYFHREHNRPLRSGQQYSPSPGTQRSMDIPVDAQQWEIPVRPLQS